MRLLKVGVYHTRYLERFYEERPRLAETPYAHQHAALIEDRVGSSDFWSRALGDRGWSTCDTIANAVPLQRQWAREQGAGVDSSLFDITRAQIRAFRPDVLLIADYSTFDATFIAEVRKECPSIRIVAGWCGGPGAQQSVLRSWDVVLSCIPEMVEDFRMQGLDAHHVHHGFDRRILDQLAPSASTSQGFTFAGSIVKRQQFHEERERLLAELVTSTPLQIFADVAEPPRPSTLLRTVLRQGRKALRSIAASRVVPRRVRRPMDGPPPAVLDPALCARAQPAVYGLRMFQQLRDSAVTFNAHIDVSPRSASNMRLFEATGVGTCLLTDWKENLRDLFTDDKEVVTYRNAAEALEKFRYLSDHPGTREEIAAAGQRRTLSDHNFERRAEQIDHVLRRALHAH